MGAVRVTPTHDLTAAMLARAGDLAHYMLTHGQTIAAASGTTPNGLPCTVVYAIGERAEMLRDVAERVVRWVGDQRDDAEVRARNN